MSVNPPIAEQQRLFDTLDRESFTGAYLAVGSLHRLFQDAPALADEGSDAAFRDHLMGRGLDESDISRYRKGEREIVLHTGPHLGGFNQAISLPELIHFLETAASICILHRFLFQRRAAHRPS